MRKFGWVAPVIVLASGAHAQDMMAAPAATPVAVLLPDPGHFFVALIAGLILAVAFQMILTNLSVAAGISAVDLDAPSSGRDSGGGDGGGVSGTLHKINAAFGLWALLTASLALFAASWLAVRLSLTVTALHGAVVGLAIWGLFYVLMMTIEASAVSSAVGSIVKVATTGLRSAFDATTGLFAKKPEDKIVDTATEVAQAVKEELFGDFDADDLKSQIQDYLKQLKPVELTAEDVANQLRGLLDDVEIEAVRRHSGPLLDEETTIATLRTKPGMTMEKARTIAGRVNDAIQLFQQQPGTTPQDKAAHVAEQAAGALGLEPEDAAKFQEKVNDFLRNTGKEELNPDAIKHELELLFDDPKAGLDALKQRLAQFDDDTIAGILAQRGDLSEEEAHEKLEQVKQVLSSIGQAKGQALAKLDDVKQGAVEKVRNYLNSLEEPQLRYEDVQRDFQKLFTDPQAGAEALMRRLKSLDRDTLKAVISSHPNIDEPHAEKLIASIEGARDSVIQKAEEFQREVARRLDAAKQEALHQADEVRQVAAGAAWWAFGTGLVSAVCSALGGWLASGRLIGG